MTIAILLGLALPGAVLVQAAPPIGTCRPERSAGASPLPSRSAEPLPPITPAPPEVEAMVAPEYGAPAAPARSTVMTRPAPPR